jgi:hypothetical protein
MAGSTTPGSKNWGDKVAIQKLTQQGGGFKRAQGTSGPLVQATTAGRPATKPVVPVTPVVNDTQTAGIPEDHQALFNEYRDAVEVSQWWEQRASAADAGSSVQSYARQAVQHKNQLAQEIKQATPNFLDS